ncbi:MAG: DUF2281 domain-containing protein [Cyanobacteria bacterium P01_G01_bin.19]
MLTPETALQKIKQLSPEQQKQVFRLIETLEKQREETEDFFEIAGIWENREVTAETLRQKAWKEENK